eukprot:TRINITY_DN19516_c0_g1_i1.p2 TRINITY_DN19516_c0_g1~~TRINITY_DN19516_c0_g1_i1.p2  ORF type:complete len:52 (-),score=2.16 TRINITY_DN19516_c0_g1_i1:77-232(-)
MATGSNCCIRSSRALMDIPISNATTAHSMASATEASSMNGIENQSSRSWYT